MKAILFVAAQTIGTAASTTSEAFSMPAIPSSHITLAEAIDRLVEKLKLDRSGRVVLASDGRGSVGASQVLIPIPPRVESSAPTGWIPIDEAAKRLHQALVDERLIAYANREGDILPVAGKHWRTDAGFKTLARTESRGWLPVLSPEGDSFLLDGEPVLLERKALHDWMAGDPSEQAPDLEPRPSAIAQPKNKGGRKDKYPWPDFYGEAVYFATLNGLDDNPEEEEEFRQHMRDWVEQTWESAPDESTVRERLSQLWNYVRRKRG